MEQPIVGDPYLEQKGIRIEYPGDIVMVLARAGGTNASFLAVLAAEVKPYKLAISADRLTEGTSARILAVTYARAIIKNLKGPRCPKAGDVPAVTEWLLADIERFDDIRALAEKGEHYVDQAGKQIVYG